MRREAMYYQPEQGQMKRHMFEAREPRSLCNHVHRRDCAVRPRGWAAQCLTCARTDRRVPRGGR